ncbi:kinase-like protein [Dichomitus squalens LYAD-421 SS1]|uniref:kinase-like protein n=1 Tax=Dichomitus squalens (strain LYAD-421) TaxID=732165 RepID=UPI0004415C0D|nr:kinase-like protein [Dichomitus squalens LYAD-421 SS1]EJF64980.1 kinase-like protein [Dichomitus squalens LYAD-421 SS1]
MDGAVGEIPNSAIAQHASDKDSQAAATGTTPKLATATGAFVDELLDSYSNEELLGYIRRSPRLGGSYSEKLIWLLSPTLVAKEIGHDIDDEPLDEVGALQLARAAGVRVPAFRRLVPEGDNRIHYIIMERIIGPTLQQLWRDLGLWGTVRAAWQLRNNLRMLHSVTSQTTGGVHTGKTRCTWLYALRGPARHASPTVFTSYLNWWLVNCRPAHLKPYHDLVLQPAKEHVLVHQDLAPRNMILDARGDLWLVDWGFAGFYPPFMEYLGMEVWLLETPWLSERTWAAWWGRFRWTVFRWITAGSFYRYRKAWNAHAIIHTRTHRFRLEDTPFSDRL